MNFNSVNILIFVLFLYGVKCTPLHTFFGYLVHDFWKSKVNKVKQNKTKIVNNSESDLFRISLIPWDLAPQFRHWELCLFCHSITCYIRRYFHPIITIIPIIKKIHFKMYIFPINILVISRATRNFHLLRNKAFSWCSCFSFRIFC